MCENILPPGEERPPAIGEQLEWRLREGLPVMQSIVYTKVNGTSRAGKRGIDSSRDGYKYIISTAGVYQHTKHSHQNFTRY